MPNLPYPAARGIGGFSFLGTSGTGTETDPFIPSVNIVGGQLPSGSPLSWSRGMGTVVSAIAKNSAGKVFSIIATNLNAATRYLQLFDRNTALSGGETPQSSYPIYASGGFLCLGKSEMGDGGAIFSTGIVWAFSTTPLTYTAGSAADVIVEVGYL